MIAVEQRDDVTLRAHRARGPAQRPRPAPRAGPPRRGRGRPPRRRARSSSPARAAPSARGPTSTPSTTRRSATTLDRPAPAHRRDPGPGDRRRQRPRDRRRHAARDRLRPARRGRERAVRRPHRPPRPGPRPVVGGPAHGAGRRRPRPRAAASAPTRWTPPAPTRSASSTASATWTPPSPGPPSSPPWRRSRWPTTSSRRRPARGSTSDDPAVNEAMWRCYDSEDAEEGRRARAERRAPSFRGR